MAESICTVCGTIGRPKSVTKGGCLIEGFLWLLLLVPGLIYSIWRLTSKHKACGQCGSTVLVPLESPVGREIAAKYHGVGKLSQP